MHLFLGSFVSDSSVVCSRITFEFPSSCGGLRYNGKSEECILFTVKPLACTPDRPHQPCHDFSFQTMSDPKAASKLKAMSKRTTSNSGEMKMAQNRVLNPSVFELPSKKLHDEAPEKSFSLSTSSSLQRLIVGMEPGGIVKGSRDTCSRYAFVRFVL